MENLNTIHLRGIVGTIMKATTNPIVRLTIATNYVYRAEDGTPVIETTWHNVIAHRNEYNTKTLDGIEKGSKVEIVGRVRNRTIVASDGESRYHTEVVAKIVELLRDQSNLEYEI